MRLQVWLCPSCSQEYDRDLIQSQLLGILHQQIMSFQLQDLKCSKCNMVKGDHLSRECACAGSYQVVVPRTAVLQKAKTLLNVARFHQVSGGQSALAGLLGLLPAHASAGGTSWSFCVRRLSGFFFAAGNRCHRSSRPPARPLLPSPRSGGEGIGLEGMSVKTQHRHASLEGVVSWLKAVKRRAGVLAASAPESDRPATAV